MTSSGAAGAFRIRVPGCVNLIGDHADHGGGLVMPMTIDRWTVIDGEPTDGPLELTSESQDEPVTIRLPLDHAGFTDMGDLRDARPAWGKYIVAVAAELGGSAQSVRGRLTSSIPVGAGLASSAALEIAVALALGFAGDAVELAELTQRAEHRATGVPSGIMDQLCIAAGVADHALLINTATRSIDPVRIPAELAVIVQFVQHRPLTGTDDTARVEECAIAERIVGPLLTASVEQVERIVDPVIRRRARHVVGENERVRRFAEALRRNDFVNAGHLMLRSHASLRDEFETSTPEIDAAVAAMASIPGVYGARMTGGGFGGCIVALADVGTKAPGWQARPVTGAIGLGRRRNDALRPTDGNET